MGTNAPLRPFAGISVNVMVSLLKVVNADAPNAADALHRRAGWLFGGLGWILVWIIPWGELPTVQAGSLLGFATDMFRLLVAVGVFVLPGVWLYMLVRPAGARLGPSGVLPVGFALSVFLISVIGLGGRVAGASFEVVTGVFAAVGLAELLVLARAGHDLSLAWNKVKDGTRGIVSNPPLLIALILSGLLTFQAPQFFIDDTTYLAYLTNWQQSQHLGFTNLIYGFSATESARFWLALYPMGQALIARLSGLAGLLLLGDYLELLLVPLAVVAAFWLARSFGLSRRAAGFAALIQISLYAWMVGDQWPVGMWFYQNMSEDKVSAVFLLAPVLFVFGMEYLRRPTRRGLALTTLAAFALALTHPVSQFYAYLIVCAVGFLPGSPKARGCAPCSGSPSRGVCR